MHKKATLLKQTHKEETMSEKRRRLMGAQKKSSKSI